MIDFTKVITPAVRKVKELRSQQEATLAAAEALLAETDWKVMRQIEEGIAMTKDELRDRKAARATISRLRDELAAKG